MKIVAGLLLLLSLARPLAAELTTAAEAAVTADPALRALIYGVPKTELHIHFEGTLEPEQYLELVHRNHLTSPYASGEAVRDRLRHGKDLPTFIEVYEELQSSMRTERDFHDVAMAYFQKARSQGVIYVEMFFDPQMHTSRGIPLAAVLDGLASAREDARAQLGVRAEYILCFNRDRSAESAAEILEASKPWLRRSIIGLGLDNPEVRDFPQKFAAVYARAKELGLRLTSHCDPNQVNTHAHLRDCLHLLGVERIDHGLNILERPELVAEARERHIGFTLCMSVFYSDIPGFAVERAGYMKRMLDAGLLVTCNSDDPGMMHSNYAADCLLITQQAAQLSREEVLTLVKNGFRIAWISDAERATYLKAVDDFVSATSGG